MLDFILSWLQFSAGYLTALFDSSIRMTKTQQTSSRRCILIHLFSCLYGHRKAVAFASLLYVPACSLNLILSRNMDINKLIVLLLKDPYNLF